MSSNPDLDPSCLSFLRAHHCAVAVSGGSDSLALLKLLKEQGDAPLTALTVDHGLREEARAEAEQVAQICETIGVPHVILKVNVDETGNTQANARDARYAIMTNYCLDNGIPHLAIGHTLDDQVETFFLNSFRGSGVDGLAAMATIRKGAPNLLRPMLNLRREDLRAFLTAREIEWVDDPSNEDAQFARVKMRNWLAQGEDLGFSIENVKRTSDNMRRMREFLGHNVEQAARNIFEFSPLYIEAKIDLSAFSKLHEEIQLRLLVAICQYYGGSTYKPRLNSLDNLRLSFAKRTGSMTLEKTEFHWNENVLRVCAELEHLSDPSSSHHWGRFVYQNDLRDVESIGALSGYYRAFEAWRGWGISARAAKTLPAIYRGGAPISADWDAFTTKSFWETLQTG